MIAAPERQIYLLSPKALSPETIAVTFAKTSRSPLSFREIAAELSDAQSAEFHEKWVVGYGHASVAEHAVLHVAFENVSRLAIESIESNRLASYTEKSTRYQRWDPGGYHLPVEVVGTPYESVFREACDHLFEAYLGSLEPAKTVVQQSNPQREGESEARWDHRIRSAYIDACRFLLPAAALANVGMTANARVLENAIRKMLSHPLEEVQAIGEELRAAATDEVPTLVKYAQAVPYLVETESALAAQAADLKNGHLNQFVDLVAYDPQAEARVLAAALYPHTTTSFDSIMAVVSAAPQEDRDLLATRLLGSLGKFDVPLRALEHAVYTAEIVVDQGGYFELKRHRMMTQTPQRMTTAHGYAVPKLIVAAGFEAAYREAMDVAERAFNRLDAWNPAVAAYVVPNGFNRRVLCTLNLRELYHLCELRSQPNAHFSMRRIVLRLAERVQELHPTLTAFLRLPPDADWRTIEADHFSQV